VFKETIHIEKRGKDHLRYSTTTVPYDKTFGEIMALLAKHECQEVATRKKGNSQLIGFVYQDKPYIVTVPQVFVGDEYDDRIGIRLVKYHLEIVLDWAKQRVIDFDYLMLGSRIVHVAGEDIPLKEAVETLPPADMFKGIQRRPELKAGGVIDIGPE
jgi:hypothetical protein